MASAEVTYLLATGGHNAGIISEPDRAGQSFQVMTCGCNERYVDPETWQTCALARSWWPQWATWLADHSGTPTVPPYMGLGREKQPIEDAPGTYVRQQ